MSVDAASAPIHTEALNALGDPTLRNDWFALAWSREVQPQQLLSRRLLGVDVVLWRSNEGLHCWRDLCVHRGARLSLGTVRSSKTTEPGAQFRACLVCPYHAWEYAPTGECVHIPAHPELVPPARARVEAFSVHERYGVVWVSLGDPIRPIPEFQICEEHGFRTILAGPYQFKAQGTRVIENLLDVAHLGFVHAGLLGDPHRGEIQDYEVIPGSEDRGPEAKQIRIWQPDPDGTGNAAWVDYQYWVHSPLTAGLIKSDESRRFALLAQVTPIDEATCESRLIMTLNYGSEASDEEFLRFQDHVTEQDRVVVESQRPEMLPLDLQEELHLRSDRMAIAYRKWLRTRGLRYGTA